MDKILAGLGSASQPTTILGGLALLSGGNGQLRAGVAQLQAGADQLASNTKGLPAAKGGVDQVKAGLDDALVPGKAIDQLAGGVTTARATVGCQTDPVCSGTLTAVLTGIQGSPTSLREKTQTASGGLGQVSGGLATAIAGVGAGPTPGPTTLRGGLGQVAGGLAQSATGLAKVTGGVDQVKLGLSNPNCALQTPTAPANPCGLREGMTLLSNGLLSAVTGVNQLASGAQTAATGSGDLAAGIAKAGDGAEQIADGSGEAAAGSEELATGLGAAEEGSAELADGAGQVAAGAGELAQGLNAAADGSGRLAAGLTKAADGAEALPEGAGRLSKEGTKKLVAAGNDTALDFGERYAVLNAMAENTQDGGLPFGAPEGATGSAAFAFELAAATHEGGRNLSRGVLAIIALAGGGALSSLVRARWF